MLKLTVIITLLTTLKLPWLLNQKTNTIYVNNNRKNNYKKYDERNTGFT